MKRASKRPPNAMKVDCLWVISREISSDWVASLSLGDISREWSCLLKAMKPGAGDQPWGGYQVPAQRSFRGCWWAWPLQEMHRALISTVNLCKSEPLCETYPQPREAQIQTHTHFMKERLGAGACAYIIRGWRHRTHFQIFSQHCFSQAFISLFLWSRESESPQCSVTSIFKCPQYALYRNGW